MKRYIMPVNGIDHVVQLSEEEAKRRGLEPAPAPAGDSVKSPAKKPAAKRRTPANKAATPEDK